MKRTSIRRISALLLSCTMLFTACASSASDAADSAPKTAEQTESTDTAENKEKQEETQTAEKTEDGISHEDLVGMFSGMGAVDQGFDVEAYLESPNGVWVTEQFEPFFLADKGLYDQTSPENFDHWRQLGMEKSYFAGDDELKEWSLFKPVSYDENKAYPLMIVLHMGGGNILMSENMGFVKNGAKNDYLVACVSWNGEGLSEAQQASFEASGLEHYEAYATSTALKKVQELANVDASRVYLAGFSGGGNAAAYSAVECPELFAGVSPSTGAAIQTIEPEELTAMTNAGMPMMMVCGQYDAEQRWPINHEAVELGPVKNEQTLEGRIDAVNAWNQAAGWKGEPETVDSVAEHAAGEGHNAIVEYGLNFDSTVDKDYDGIEYSLGDLYNDQGQTVARYMSVENCPHFVAPHWAEEIYEFFSHYSRSQETGQIEYSA